MACDLMKKHATETLVKSLRESGRSLRDTEEDEPDAQHRPPAGVLGPATADVNVPLQVWHQVNAG